MKNLIQKVALLMAFASIVLISGCSEGRFCIAAKGDVVTETIPLEAITGFDLTIAADVNVHYGEAQEIKVTGASNIIENLERNVSNGIWEIKNDKCVRKSGKLEIDITIPSLTHAKISGSGNVKGDDAFSGGSNMDLGISGSGNIDLKVDADVVDIDISGSGDIALETHANTIKAKLTGSGSIDLTGSCVTENLSITGSGSVNAFGMVAQDVTASISGSGNCNINATQSLNVNITGSGSVNYTGTPTVDADISGSGTLNHVN